MKNVIFFPIFFILYEIITDFKYLSDHHYYNKTSKQIDENENR